MSTIEECEALAKEFFLAWRVGCHEGERVSGIQLYRLRQLPPKEQAYFAALAAPYEDPHYLTRVGTNGPVNEYGRTTVTYTPPYPEPCACGRPVFVAHETHSVRCSRCLHAWPFSRLEPAVRETPLPRLSNPIVDSVSKADIGYAIERVLPSRRTS